MSSSAAAELRRQKILQNREERIKLLIGVKNSETATTSSLSSPSSSESLTKISNNNETSIANLNANNNNNNKLPPPTKLSSSSNLLSGDDLLEDYDNTNKLDEDDLFTTTSTSAQKRRRNSIAYKSLSSLSFNGYSNSEILILSLLALFTCLALHFKQSDYIFRNALLPFFTFESAHLIVYLKYLPSTSSQFQVFRTLLQLCGISPKSLNNLMIFINFMFMLIDNFVIYIFSFVFIFFLIDFYQRTVDRIYL